MSRAAGTAGVPCVAADWALVPVTTRTEVAERLALAGAMRSLDEITRFMAQYGSADNMRDVREGWDVVGRRLPDCVCSQTAHDAPALVARASCAASYDDMGPRRPDWLHQLHRPNLNTEESAGRCQRCMAHFWNRVR